MTTQQQWLFEVETGVGVFTHLEKLMEFPEFTPNNRTLRDATYIDIAQASETKNTSLTA